MVQNFHHPDGDLINGSVTWSTVADMARPRVRCLLRGDESEVESNGGCDEAPVHCVFAVVTARQPACSPDSVFSPCQMVCDVAAAQRRRVLHSGGLLGAVWSVSLVSPSARGYALLATSWDGKGC